MEHDVAACCHVEHRVRIIGLAESRVVTADLDMQAGRVEGSAAPHRARAFAGEPTADSKRLLDACIEGRVRVPPDTHPFDPSGDTRRGDLPHRQAGPAELGGSCDTAATAYLGQSIHAAIVRSRPFPGGRLRSSVDNERCVLVRGFGADGETPHER
ncbi:MAG TPA: hypothetical protein VN200_06465 [Rhodoglobus sp.]|nr:hypothetical protein [Rhodoglobus sp.]